MLIGGEKDKLSTREDIRWLKNELKENVIYSKIIENMGHLSFIVGKDLEERLSIKERFKKFYSKRSAVVHGGSTEMDKNLYYEFFSLKIGELVRN